MKNSKKDVDFLGISETCFNLYLKKSEKFSKQLNYAEFLKFIQKF